MFLCRAAWPGTWHFPDSDFQKFWIQVCNHHQYLLDFYCPTRLFYENIFWYFCVWVSSVNNIFLDTFLKKIPHVWNRKWKIENGKYFEISEMKILKIKIIIFITNYKKRSIVFLTSMHFIFSLCPMFLSWCFPQ